MSQVTEKQKQLAEAVINALSAPGSVKNNVNILTVAQILADAEAELAACKMKTDTQKLAEELRDKFNLGFVAIETLIQISEHVEAQQKPLRVALEKVLFAWENADETGYVTDVGFLDMDAIKDTARQLLK